MFKIFTRGKVQMKSKKSLILLFIFSFVFSMLIFFCLAFPAVTLINSTEKVISTYQVSDIKCSSYKPQNISIDKNSLQLDYSKCIKIKNLPQDLSITIKVIPSYYYSFITELIINEIAIIGKDYSQYYYYMYLFIGLLWFLLSAFILFISLVYLKILLNKL